MKKYKEFLRRRLLEEVAHNNITPKTNENHNKIANLIGDNHAHAWREMFNENEPSAEDEKHHKQIAIDLLNNHPLAPFSNHKEAVAAVHDKLSDDWVTGIAEKIHKSDKIVISRNHRVDPYYNYGDSLSERGNDILEKTYEDNLIDIIDQHKRYLMQGSGEKQPYSEFLKQNPQPLKNSNEYHKWDRLRAHTDFVDSRDMPEPLDGDEGLDPLD